MPLFQVYLPDRKTVITTRDFRFLESDCDIPKVSDPSDPGPPCARCGSKDETYPSRMLLCDCTGCPHCIKTPDASGCFRSYHMACLNPPRTRLPSGSWICPECSSAGHAAASGNNMPATVAPPPLPPAPDAAPPPLESDVLRRGSRLRTQLQRFTFLTTAPPPLDTNPEYPPDPTTLAEALASPQCEDWQKAVNSEITSLFSNGTFDIIDTPQGVRPIGSKWIFKRKYDAFGFLLKYKARLVAKGFLQRYGRDYFDVFSPVSKMTSLRLLLAYAAAHNLALKQLDVATAFLNGDLDEQVFVQIPDGLSEKYPNKCFYLRKAIYGLKQAPRVWWLTLSSTLLANGFTPSFADTCLFYRQGKHGLVLMLVYVDDILATGHPDDVSEALKVITDNYACSEIDDVRSFLGMAITRDLTAGTISISQHNFIDQIADKLNFSLKVPYHQHTPILETATDFDGGVLLPPDNEYASLIGSLLYLANCTRPDISFAVNTLARHLRNPTEAHMHHAKKLLRYVLTTKHLSLVYGKPSNPNKLIDIEGYSDSNYANPTFSAPGETFTRRSVSGSVFLANGTPICWSSKKQVTVARSTDEAEYQAMAASASQALWLRKLLAEFEPPARVLKVFCDNMASLTHVLSPGSMNKTKHVDVQFQFVLDRLTRGDLSFEYVPSADNIADIFTKGLSRPAFEKLRSKLFLSPS